MGLFLTAAIFAAGFLVSGGTASSTAVNCQEHPDRCPPTTGATTTGSTTTSPTTTTAPTTTTRPTTTTAPTTTTRPTTTTAPTTTTRPTTTTAPTTTTRPTTTTAPTTTAAPPTSSSPPLFVGNFDSGSFKPWGTPQCANYGNPTSTATRAFGNFSLDSNIVGEGAYAARFDVPADATHLTRCQVITKRPVNSGGDDYYSLMFYLPNGWTTGITPPGYGVMIAQLNYQGLGPGSANVSLIAFPDHVTLVMATGITTTTGTPAYQFNSNADVTTRYINLPKLYAVPPGMQLGVWHELIIHAHWATDSSGKIDAWHRVKGQSGWTNTASLSGYPTLQENPDGSYPGTTIDMIGAYRMRSVAPTSVWLDGFSRSGSFAGAAANLP